MARELPEQLRTAVKLRDNSRCRGCGMTDWESLQADHIVPRAMGGSDDIDNLQCLCYVCNTQIKQDHPIGELPIQPPWDDSRPCSELTEQIVSGRNALRQIVAEYKNDQWQTLETIVAEWKASGVRKLIIRNRLQKLLKSQNKIEKLLN